MEIEAVDVTGAGTRQRRDLGAALVRATGEVFADLTVNDNLRLAAGGQRPEDVVTRRIEELVATFGGLERNLSRAAGVLNGGAQRMVGVARALMTQPRLLLLDESTNDLARATAIHLLSIAAQQARQRSMGVLIAEVNLAAALQIADRA